MGQRPTAKLVYGFDLGEHYNGEDNNWPDWFFPTEEQENAPDFDEDDFAWPGEIFDDFLRDTYYEETGKTANEDYRAFREWELEFPLILVTTVSYDYPNYIIGARKAFFSADWDGWNYIEPEDLVVDPKDVAEAMKWLKKMEFKNIAGFNWILACLYG